MTVRCIFIGFALLLTCAAPTPRAFAQSDAKASTLQQIYVHILLCMQGSCLFKIAHY